MVPIYYTEIMFCAYGTKHFRISLNIHYKELSYEEFDSFGKVDWNYEVNLKNEQFEQLIPYINAYDFEPFRNKEQLFTNFIGYRDEYWIEFVGITDSYIPKLELPMTIIYDEAHTWPNEKLYQYLLKNYVSTWGFEKSF